RRRSRWLPGLPGRWRALVTARGLPGVRGPPRGAAPRPAARDRNRPGWLQRRGVWPVAGPACHGRHPRCEDPMKRGGVKQAIEYQFTAGAPRPARIPRPNERHTKLVDAVIATARDTTSVTVVAPAGVVAPKFASILRQAVRKRVLRENLPLKIELRVQGQ